MLESMQSRRALLRSALTLAGGAFVASCASPRATHLVSAAPPVPVPPQPVHAPAPVTTASRLAAPAGVRPELFEQAVAALDRHAARIPAHDRIAIADFTLPSSQPRFHIVRLGTGEVVSHLVAHGSGSDPSHTGFLQRFSNTPGSNATCEGAFLCAEYYVGQHGMSQRLEGLDPTNDNARARAIVVHGAWYSNPDMLQRFGKLGRSQGCFAVGENELARVFEELGPGRMIFASRA